MDTKSSCGSIGVMGALGLACLAAPAAAQVTVRASVHSAGTQSNGDAYYPSISSDGRYVAFLSIASNLVAGDTNGKWDIFVRDLVSGTTERVSLDSAGVQGNGDSGDASFPAGDPSISADGRYVAFFSFATNLVGADTNGTWDIFVRDRVSGTTERVSLSSLGAQGNGVSFFPSISADGRFVAFGSEASNLVPGDTAADDIFVRDRASGTTERVSVNASGGQVNLDSSYPSISGDGRYVAFESQGTNLVPGDTNAVRDIFVRDRTSGTTERMSVDSLGTQSNGASTNAAISADGRYVAFFSSASNLVAGDTNFGLDVFVHDRVAGTTERVSLTWLGAQATNSSFYPSISPDGRYVAFESEATNLVPGDTNGARDMFVRDLLVGTTTRVDVSSQGTQSNGPSWYGSISGAGSVAFESVGSSLVTGDTNGHDDVFVRNFRESGSAFCSPGEQGILACPCAPGTDAPHDAGHGCSNSLHSGGGSLVGTGAAVAGAATDTLVMTATDIGSGLTIFLEAPSAGSGLAFGDGVLCLTGQLRRFGTTNAVLRTAAYPDDAADPPISVFTGALAGQTKYYQAYYRNPATWCNAATFNISNGYRIVWQ